MVLIIKVLITLMNIFDYINFVNYTHYDNYLGYDVFIIFLYQLTEPMEAGQIIRNAQKVAEEGSRAETGRVTTQNLNMVAEIVRLLDPTGNRQCAIVTVAQQVNH